MKPSSRKLMVCAVALMFFGSAFLAAPANASVLAADAQVRADSAPVGTSETSGVEQADGSTVFTSEQVELTVLPNEDPQPIEAELSLLAPSIGCSLNVQNVHASSHVSGTINGVAVVSCTGPAGQLTLHYSLIRVSPNYTQWGAGQKTNAGQVSLQNNRAVPCSEGPGQFRGWAQGVIVPPPGYTLVGPATHQDYGPLLSVACGAAFATDGAEPSISESTSVTFIRSDLVG
jgi:hypothetical protein